MASAFSLAFEQAGIRVTVSDQLIFPAIFELLHMVAPDEYNLSTKQMESHLDTYGTPIKCAFINSSLGQGAVYSGYNRANIHLGKYVADILANLFEPTLLGNELGGAYVISDELVNKRKLALLKIVEHVFFKNAQEHGQKLTGTNASNALLTHVVEEDLIEFREVLSAMAIGKGGSEVAEQISKMLLKLDDEFIGCTLTQVEADQRQDWKPPMMLKNPHLLPE